MQSKVSWFKRVLLTGKTRIELYELLALLLENRELMIDALRTIRGVYNNDMGEALPRSENRIDDIKPRNVTAEAIHSWIAAIKEGYGLSAGMAAWVPAEEAALVQAGERTGNLVRALRDCVTNIQSKGQMTSAVMSGTIYPVALFCMAYYVMRIFATKVIPRFESQVPEDMWEGPAKWLYIQSHLFNDYSIPVVIVTIVLLIAAFASLPYLRGPLRVFLDRFVPPWNIYRMVQGATFLKNVAVQARAGIILVDSVDSMMQTATPWLRERLQAALYGIQQGQDLGMSLHNAGYDFPDRRAVQILRVLATRDGFEETIYTFAERWTEQTVKSVKAASSVMLTAGILAVGFVAGSSFLGMQGISNIIQDKADAVTNTAGNKT